MADPTPAQRNLLVKLQPCAAGSNHCFAKRLTTSANAFPSKSGRSWEAVQPHPFEASVPLRPSEESGDSDRAPSSGVGFRDISDTVRSSVAKAATLAGPFPPRPRSAAMPLRLNPRIAGRAAQPCHEPVFHFPPRGLPDETAKPRSPAGLVHALTFIDDRPRKFNLPPDPELSTVRDNGNASDALPDPPPAGAGRNRPAARNPPRRTEGSGGRPVPRGLNFRGRSSIHAEARARPAGKCQRPPFAEYARFCATIDSTGASTAPAAIDGHRRNLS